MGHKENKRVRNNSTNFPKKRGQEVPEREMEESG